MDTDEMITRFQEYAQKHPITKQEGNFSLLLYGTAFSGVVTEHFEDLFGFDFGKLIYVTGEKDGILFFNQNKYTQSTKGCYNRFLDQASLKKLFEYKQFNQHKQSIDEAYKNFSREELQSLDDKELADKLKKGFDLFHRFLVATVFSEAMNQGLVNDLHAELDKRTVSTDGLMEFAFLKDFYSIPYRENREVINYKKSGEALNSQWILADYYLAPDYDSAKNKLDKKVTEESIDQLKASQSEYEQELKENQKKIDEFKEGLSKQERNLLEFVQFAIWIRDTRKEHMQKLMTVISYYARAYLKNKGADQDLAPYIFSFDFLKKEAYSDCDYIDTLKERKSGSVGLFEKSEYHLNSTNNPDPIRNDLAKNLEGAQESGITGQTAYEGKVKGEVKVVSSTDEFDKFTEGDILVTSMTRPEFVPIMKKAAAVVTDEGGITCHAAIVSRELEIPCIIGTETATQKLEDGDEVEVDADKGVVTLIDKR
jgi:phosphohistidine swiveling domain-containing protein